jgi:ferredoxin
MFSPPEQHDGCFNPDPNDPAGAITPEGDKVIINPQICAGVCPTGAVGYAMPRREALSRRTRTLRLAYEAGGGKHAILLFHDGDFGEEMIAMMARYYDGLPANVLPIAVNGLGQCGLDTLLAARVYGAGRRLILAPPRMTEELAGPSETIMLSNHILAALGFGDGRAELIVEADPEAANAQLWAAAGEATDGPRAVAVEPTEEKRTALNLALTASHRVAPEPRREIPLPDGAPFGTAVVDVDGCALCLACANGRPTNALRDTPDYPPLNFVETACVQRGLCVSTCPEKVITLRPRLVFTVAARDIRVIKEEEPFDCIRCGTPFATKSMIETVSERMSAHSMFPNEQALWRLKMCADCRIVDMAETNPDPMTAGARPKPRTSDDYLGGLIADDPDDDVRS